MHSLNCIQKKRWQSKRVCHNLTLKLWTVKEKSAQTELHAKAFVHQKPLATLTAWKTQEQWKYSKLPRNLLTNYIESSSNSTTLTKNIIQTWVEDLNNHVFREDKQVVNKHRKNASTWLNMRKCKSEPQWNTTSHKANTNENQPTEKSKHQERGEIGTLLYYKLECKMRHAAAVGHNVVIFLRLKIWLPYESATALLNLYPKELKICVFEELFEHLSLLQYYLK